MLALYNPNGSPILTARRSGTKGTGSSFLKLSYSVATALHSTSVFLIQCHQYIASIKIFPINSASAL